MAKPDKKDKSEKEPAKQEEETKVQAGGWDDEVKVHAREFKGPAGVDEPLRIAMTKEAYADIISHAKDSLDREICGVLLGRLCEDDYGFFLDIAAVLRGGAAKSSGTHVTFTQETWNEIHKAKEDRYRKLDIVGWYHSHPGFGVEFSDMDLFIQKNFFGGPSQIAFVIDPLGGDEAIDANVKGEITPIKRFWVDGRERRCYVPQSAAGKSSDEKAPAAVGVSGDLQKSIEGLQDRVRQLTETVEKQRNFFYNILTFIGMTVAFVVVLIAGIWIWNDYYGRKAPPAEFAERSIPMVIDNKLVFVTVSLKKWEPSPELTAKIVQDIGSKYIEDLQLYQASTQPATATGTAPASTSANSQPAAPAKP